MPRPLGRGEISKLILALAKPENPYLAKAMNCSVIVAHDLKVVAIEINKMNLGFLLSQE